MAIAPDSLVVADGIDLARTTAWASQQSPALGGVSLRIVDPTGAERFAPLLYVSPGLIHFIMPTDIAPGFARVTVIHDDGAGPDGKALIERVAPGLFTAEGSGRGAAVAFAIENTPEGSARRLPLYRCADGRCATVPLEIAPGVSTQVMFLYTGIATRALLWICR